MGNVKVTQTPENHMPRTFKSDEEIEAQMVPQIVKAIYPALIPVEQACMKIQAHKHEGVTKAATEMWRSWRKFERQ